MDTDDTVHRLAGSSGTERGGLVIMKKKKTDNDNGMAPPPKKSVLGKCSIQPSTSIIFNSTLHW